MKEIHLKIWPEINGYLPALIPFQSIGTRENDLFIDFSNCKRANSSGLNILLMRILRLLKSDNKERSWNFDFQSNKSITSVFEKLNFFQILNFYNKQKKLFWKFETNELFSMPMKIQDSNNISYPIYIIDFKKSLNDRRDAISTFRSWLYGILEGYVEEFDFNFTQLITILTEMAKNSADHTQDNAFFGFDVEIGEDRNKICLLFSFFDLGVGIKQNIQNHIASPIAEKRKRHWSLAESYYFALQPGKTTKPGSIQNKGIGMSIIVDGAQGAMINLSVFDAMSRGLLSDVFKISHSEIRNIFFNTGRDVGFCYYGELWANRAK
jgi:hypothetical protein